MRVEVYMVVVVEVDGMFNKNIKCNRSRIEQNKNFEGRLVQ